MPRPFRLKQYIPPEQDEQIVFADWLRAKKIKFSASANGGSRHLLEAVKLKRMGVSKGYPDVSIPLARKGYHGLYIELKRVKGGVVSPEQQEWGEYLMSEGYAWHVANGASEAIKIVLDYIA